jgi:hypothetical protein
MAFQINIPPRETDLRARYNGWNFDPRWEFRDIVWNGQHYDITDKQTVAKPGERPIVAFVGGKGNEDNNNLALQFVQQNGKVVGMRSSFYTISCYTQLNLYIYRCQYHCWWKSFY